MDNDTTAKTLDYAKDIVMPIEIAKEQLAFWKGYMKAYMELAEKLNPDNVNKETEKKEA